MTHPFTGRAGREGASFSVSLLIAAAACACACSAPVAAQSFALPIDVEQGLVFGADRPRTPYLFGLRMTPSLDLGRARFGLVLGPSYRNPKWDFALGGRMSLFVPLAERAFGLRFVVQGEYLPRQQAGRASVGVLGELLGLLRIGVWPAYDFEALQPELCIGIGWDVMGWARVLQDDL